MSNLFKKVWDSVSIRSNSTKLSSPKSSSSFGLPNLSVSVSISDLVMMCCSCTGEFDKIPLDIFMQILKLLEPKDVARLASVCKSWKVIVSDNSLWMYHFQKQHVAWENIFFSEISLRSGYPLQ